MGQRFTQVDAFTDRPFCGNPAAVLVVDDTVGEGWLRDVAREMNLSETAFLMEHEDGFDLRWFTPAAEVDLCGHATLASAHALWEEGRLDEGAEARFHTRSGILTCRKEGSWIWMDFPALPATEVDPPDGLVRALGVEPLRVARSRFDLLVELDSEKAVRTLSPDMAAIGALPARGVIVTAPAVSSGVDFVSRFFAPAVGVDEDPVTGSAHCVLGPWWSGRMELDELVGYQVSARGGRVRIRMRGDRVELGGQAVTTLRGEVLPQDAG
jgi:PhzF family phenazine biosynthesis protein